MPDPVPVLDLNCDLAEGEPPARTATLMALVTSANVACGGHAGSVGSMRHAIDLGRTLGVRLGAHPGLPGNFGRGDALTLTPAEFRAVLHSEVGRFLDAAAAAGAAVHHVKLHGALYHATEHAPSLRTTFVEFMAAHAPNTVVYAIAGGRTVAALRAAGLSAWDEAFADRAYLADGSLVPRGQPGAVLSDPAEIADRVTRLARGEPILAIDGTPLRLHPQTLCIHGDSPNSISLLHAARAALNPTNHPDATESPRPRTDPQSPAG